VAPPPPLFAEYRMEWVAPKGYASLPGVRCSFHGGCRTPDSCEDEGMPGEVYAPVGVFGDPELSEPEIRHWVFQRLGRLGGHDILRSISSASSSYNTNRRFGTLYRAKERASGKIRMGQLRSESP